MKNKWPRIAVVGIGLMTLVAVACQSQIDSSSPQAQSNDKLRSGLADLDTGNQLQAELDLKDALNTDPLNSRARTALASLYAKEAGITVQDWLDPFINAARDIAAKIREVNTSSDFVDTVTKSVQAANNEAPTTESEQDIEIRKRAIDLTDKLAKFGLAAHVTLDLMNSTPYLSDAQLAQLDRAIQLLRNNGMDIPENRSEEARSYQAVLSFIRLVNHLKRIVGDTSRSDVSSEIGKLCSTDSSDLKVQLLEVKQSLIFTEEGLTTSPSDPNTSTLAARQKMQAFLTTMVEANFWDNLDDLFDPSTPDGKSAANAVQAICGKPNAAAQLSPVGLPSSLPSVVSVSPATIANPMQSPIPSAITAVAPAAISKLISPVK